MAKKNRKVSNWEIFWIVVSGILAVGGLFLLVLGLVGSFIPVLNSENWILSSQSALQAATGLSYIWLGAIILVVDSILACIYLNYFAKRSDLDSERALRRAQRLKVIADSEKVSETPVVEAETTDTVAPSSEGK